MVEQGQQSLGEPGEVPLRHDRLVAVGVAPARVDRAVDRGRVEGLHEGARPVVDGLTRDRRVVGVHDSVNEPEEHPLSHQRGLGGDHRLEQCQIGALGLRGARVVTGDRVVGEAAQEGDVTRGGGVLEAAHAQMAARDPGEHGTWQQGLAAHQAPRRHDRQGAGRRDPECVHGRADDVLAQHRADRSQAVAAARERRAPGALEVEVAKMTIGVDDLTQQKCAPVAQTRGEPPELVPGVGLRHRSGTAGDEVADQQAQTIGAAQRGRIEAEFGG